MSTPPISDPYQIYLDCTYIIDLVDSSRARHNNATKLLDLFQAHQFTDELIIMTSMWAVIEAEGVMYGTELERASVPQPVRSGRPRSVRDVIPIRKDKLQKASQDIENLLETFRQTTNFRYVSLQTADSANMWPLIREIGQNAAIWPADSLHLAIALQEGCSMIITDDNNFCDKIDLCKSDIIIPYRSREFSHVTLPDFEVYGVYPTSISYRVPRGHARSRRPALDILTSMGF